MELTLDTRNADLGDLRDILQDQRARRLDVVASPGSITAEGAQLRIAGTEQVLSDEGVTTAAGLYRPTKQCDRGIGESLGVPSKYMAWMRQNRPDLWDANVNGLLHGGLVDNLPGEGAPLVAFPPDGRNFMIRLLRGDESGTGVARAFLSDKYQRIDNLDVLVAALAGVNESGIDAVVDGCDLTEQRMYVRIAAPGVAAMAPGLLEGYRNPLGEGERAGGWKMDTPGWWGGGVERAFEAAALEGKGYPPGQEPVVFAGFVISNSETGGGAFSLVPRITFRVCRNGLQITADALRRVHLGRAQEEGVIEWSKDTEEKQLALVTARARDAVATFLSEGYLEKTIKSLSEKAGVPVTSPADTIREVVKVAEFPREYEDAILNMFIKGGQLTAAGVMNAVTATAQTVDDADVAMAMEASAVKVLETAAKIG